MENSIKETKKVITYVESLTFVDKCQKCKNIVMDYIVIMETLDLPHQREIDIEILCINCMEKYNTKIKLKIDVEEIKT